MYTWNKTSKFTFTLSHKNIYVVIFYSQNQANSSQCYFFWRFISVFQFWWFLLWHGVESLLDCFFSSGMDILFSFLTHYEKVLLKMSLKIRMCKLLIMENLVLKLRWKLRIKSFSSNCLSSIKKNSMFFLHYIYHMNDKNLINILKHWNTLFLLVDKTIMFGLFTRSNKTNNKIFWRLLKNISF